ncbi:MFS transporter [Sphingomonas sp. SRS2]|uniref:MFS transporter n=1 Tax=Sphingomonas sp. SRS2 TaxID=133190 RepID=UPI0006184BAD|nr:MFS transporter [Sphingomonas sp. SRS2]KKC24586.1 MFS transporter [Sphingomonas sp. SRS2]
MTDMTATPPSTRRILLASLTGTSVEFYDFYIFATAASLVFGPLFFGGFEQSTQLIWAYTLLGLAFLSRPLGAWAFGHFGDRIGRKSTLVASLMVMGLSTLLIAFLPSYETAGWIGAFLLAVLRFGQGFGLGGEWGGAALLAVENAPPNMRGRYGMFPQLGAPVGFIAANGLFLILGMAMTQQQFMDWGWRLPFLGSAVLVGVGLWVRLKLTETAAFQEAMAHSEPAKVPIAELFRDHLVPTVAGTFAAVACFATYYLATAFALGYGTATLGIPKETFLGVQLVTILFMAAGILLAGWWSDVKTPRYVLIAGCIGTIGTGLLMGPMFLSADLTIIAAWLALALFMMGFVYGPLGAFLPSLFPPRVRYTGASMTFNIAGILGAAPVPAVAQYLSDHGGLGYVGFYLSASALLSLVALWWTRHHDAKSV